MREILFVAGEVSGDLHAAAVARELNARNAPFALTGIGGEEMRAAGVELIEHVENLAVMGFIEAAQARAEVLGAAARAHASHSIGRPCGARRPDRLSDLQHEGCRGSDSGGRAGVVLHHAAGVGVGRGSIGAARENSDESGADPSVRGSAAREAQDRCDVCRTSIARSLGDVARSVANGAGNAWDSASDDRVLALFPGSRAQEIERHLDAFVATAKELERRDPSLRVIVSVAPHINVDPARCPFEMVRSESFTVLRAADAAMCKSGTTTLEAAVAGCPLVVAYRARAFDYAVGQALSKDS